MSLDITLYVHHLPPQLPCNAGRTLWVDLGSQGVFLEVTLASLWLPWVAGGPFWGTLGSQVELGVSLGQNWMSFPRVFGAFAMPAHKK